MEIYEVMNIFGILIGWGHNLATTHITVRCTFPYIQNASKKIAVNSKHALLNSCLNTLYGIFVVVAGGGWSLA